jgi:large repetitive protein
LPPAGGNGPPVPVINAPSCTGRTCTFSSAGTADPNGDAFTYLWNWGDLTATSTASAPSHTFPTVSAFTVTLTVTDAWGDAASTTRLVELAAPTGNAPPVPAIDAPVCAGRSCTFSAATSSDPNGDTFSYLWDWGDGTAAGTAATATHAFAVDGTYVVTLTLTDVWGAAASITRSVTIARPTTNLAPVPVITGPVCAARACTFYGVSSSDPNSDPFTYLWTLGDGSTSTAVSPAKTYAADGTYTVTLTVTDAWGDTALATLTFTIAEPTTNAAPTPVIGIPTCNGRVCTFSAAGSSDPNGDPFTASWAWSDGTPNSTGTSPTHTFPTAGTFTVTLTLTDGWGDTAMITRQVTVA